MWLCLFSKICIFADEFIVKQDEPEHVAETLYETYTNLTALITNDMLIREGNIEPGMWGNTLFLIKELMEVFEYMTRFPKK